MYLCPKHIDTKFNVLWAIHTLCSRCYTIHGLLKIFLNWVWVMPCVNKLDIVDCITWQIIAIMIWSSNIHNWGEPERAPHWSNSVPRNVYIYVYMYRTSFRKCPRVLIHWTASILLSVIQFRKCHHVQIIETASINLHLQWATTSMYAAITAWSSWVGQIQLQWAKLGLSRTV